MIWLVMAEKSNGAGLSSSSPDWIFAASSIRLTMRDRRRVSSAMMRRYLSRCSSGMVPSIMPSTKPPIVVIGVLNSWLTFEIKPRVSSSS